MKKMYSEEQMGCMTQNFLTDIGMLDENGKPINLFGHSIILYGKSNMVQSWTLFKCSFGILKQGKECMVSFKSFVQWLNVVGLKAIVGCPGSIHVNGKGFFLFNWFETKADRIILHGQYLTTNHNEDTFTIREEDFQYIELRDILNP